MSFEAIAWAWNQPLSKDEHLIVLLALANIANEKDEIWASQPYIAAMARKEERTVRRALLAMLAMENPPISVRARPGTTDVITLNIPEEFTIKKKRPPAEGRKRGRPIKSLVIEAENPGHGGEKPPSTVSDKPIKEPVLNHEATVVASDARGTRLPKGWEPDPTIATLIGLDHDRAADQLDRFRDYWNSKAGKDARKVDWTGTWRNWCRNALERTNGRGSPATRYPTDADRAAERTATRIDPMLQGAQQALARPRRWKIGG